MKIPASHIHAYTSTQCFDGTTVVVYSNLATTCSGSQFDSNNGNYIELQLLCNIEIISDHLITNCFKCMASIKYCISICILYKVHVFFQFFGFIHMVCAMQFSILVAPGSFGFNLTNILLVCQVVAFYKSLIFGKLGMFLAIFGYQTLLMVVNSSITLNLYCLFHYFHCCFQSCHLVHLLVHGRKHAITPDPYVAMEFVQPLVYS